MLTSAEMNIQVREPATDDLGSRILVADDDELFRESLARNLAHAGFLVEEANDGLSVLQRLQDGTLLDLLLLDWKMPRMNGIDVLRQLREAGHNVPVLFLTVLDGQIYEEAALQLGAYDFVDKHRAFAILLKRIELILAGGKSSLQNGGTTEHSLRVGQLELRADIGRAIWRDRRIDLSLTEFHIVSRLASAPGSDVSYRELYDLVRGEGFVAGRGSEGYRGNVRSIIKRIRQKFKVVDPDFRQIDTYTGFGYCWREGS